MRHYLIQLLSPGNLNTKYKIWVALSLIIQVVCTLVPAMYNRGADELQEIFLFGSLGVAIVSMLVTVSNWQKWIAFTLAVYGLTLCLLLVILDLTNTGMLLYLLAWSMSMSLGYGRELYNLKWFFGFMSLVLVFFAMGLYFSPNTYYPGIERAASVLSGTFIIAVNIYLWSKEAQMSSNHYSERRQKYEDIASLSEKMTAILSSEQDLHTAFHKIAKEGEPGLHLDYCMIYLLDNDLLVSVDGKEKVPVVPQHLIGSVLLNKATQVITDNSLSNYKNLDSFAEARSEIAAPIFNSGKIAGVIYGASREKDVIRERHDQAINVIASFCGLKLTQIDAEESIREAERTKAEVDRYKELDDLKNRFIANISHDLKTPLSLIKAPAKQIAMLTKNEKILSLSKYVINNADHLMRVVHQLLQLNRIEKGINELYFQQVELSNLCQKINGQYEERAGSKSIKLNMHAESIVMITDAFRLEQIIHNLLSNALSHTNSGGTIEVGLSKTEDKVRCIVHDTGVGIPLELQNKVFDRFYKIDQNNQEGTGIGLSLVKEYTELLEGTIELESEEGRGTKFTLEFPLIHSASEERDQQERVSRDSIHAEINGKPHMLIVEDHADLNSFISSYFENEFVTLSAYDGEEALERMEQMPPDIIITDLMMPKRDGKALVEEIRNNDDWAHIPIIVLSAKSQVISKIELYESGVDNFLAKPFDIEELDAVVNATLNKRRQLRDLFRRNYLVGAESAAVISDPVENGTDAEVSPQVSNLLDELKALVMEHLDDSDLAINDIAKKMGVGRNRFQKEVKELSGVTPVEFVRSLRLNEAYRLLGDRSKNISEVAYAVGFANLSYFTRSFKQEFGKLPSELQS